MDGTPSKVELYDMAADPGQKQDVAAQHPEVVSTLKRKYEEWWKLTSGRATEKVRIVLGRGKTRLSSHDWHGAGAEAAWNQQQIRRAPAANGTWAVEVERAGLYRIELRRWPVEVDLSITAPYRDPQPNRETTPGQAVPVVKARLKLGALDQSCEVKPEDKAAVFEVRLPAGPAELQSWLYSSDGTERGAYYVYAELLKA
jgi:hypothetical protein